MGTRRMCAHCRAFMTTKGRVCPYCNEKVGPRAAERRDPGALLGGLIPQARFFSMIILVINFGLYVATTIYSMRAGGGQVASSIDGRTLFDFGAKYPPALAAGQWWRLVTAGFLHGVPGWNSASHRILDRTIMAILRLGLCDYDRREFPKDVFLV